MFEDPTIDFKSLVPWDVIQLNNIQQIVLLVKESYFLAIPLEKLEDFKFLSNNNEEFTFIDHKDWLSDFYDKNNMPLRSTSQFIDPDNKDLESRFKKCVCVYDNDIEENKNEPSVVYNEMEFKRDCKIINPINITANLREKLIQKLHSLDFNVLKELSLFFNKKDN